jgi:glycosyltransferase involved in cell wall biosynthesis
MMKCTASIIIATTASPQRSSLLMRALRSLQLQDEAIVPIVVVNGSQADPELVQSLQRRRDIRYLQLDEGNLPRALLAGRRAVDTEFFGILDDDDEYLPGAVKARLRPFAENPSIDAVVSNGYVVESNRERIAVPDFSAIPSDPLGHLMDRNWLPSCAGLYRTKSLPPSYLDVPRYMEFTYMALSLALNKKLHFLDVPTYRVYRDSPGSLSNTSDYALSEPIAIRQMLDLKPPTRIKRQLEKKYASALHCLSDSARGHGNYKAAWLYHLQSLLTPYGIHYLFYTRHLVPGIFA